MPAGCCSASRHAGHAGPAVSQPQRRFDRELREWVYAADSPIHGRGLFARRAIARGEYIGTFWGPEVKRDGVYVLWVTVGAGDAGVIGRSGRNMLRYLNHARRPNAEFDGFELAPPGWSPDGAL